jgi:hypothetical protein
VIIALALGTGLPPPEIVGLNVGAVSATNGPPRVRARVLQEIAKGRHAA